MLLAADHGISLGAIPGLEDLKICRDEEIASIFSGVVLNRGAISQALPYESSLGLVVQTFGSPVPGSEAAKRPLVSLDQLLPIGPDGIAVELNLSLPQATESMEQASRSIQAADLAGIPVLLMITASMSGAAIEAFVHALRIGTELGADLIKIGLSEEVCAASASQRKTITSAIAASRPVLLAGGPAASRFGSVVKLSSDLGFSGVCVGRNIFGSKNREQHLQNISETYLESILAGGAS